MIDPSKITKFDCTEKELQELILFWICAAGKKATTVAKGLDLLLKEGKKLFNSDVPFEIIRNFGSSLPYKLKEHGIGCYNNKSKSMLQIAHSELDLKKCSADDLENIYGIGMKTSRCFLMHSRKNCNYAGLDTHVLKYMRESGIDVPKSTPTNKKKYIELERKFLEIAEKTGKSVAEFDLEIWNYYSSNKNKEYVS